MNMQDLLFETGGQPTHRRPRPFSPFGPARTRRFARPTHISRIPRGTNIAAGLTGADLTGLDLFRQGEEVAAIMEASNSDGLPLYPTVVALIPRRATKTTSIWNVLLGRCVSIPGYKVVTTAQDGIRARNRFREIQRILDSPAVDFEGTRNAGHRMGRLRWANGDESIEFDNGSRLWVVPPEPGAFRGEASDAMLFDEAGELSPEKSEALVAGALPLMDTRPRGQVIIAGTPAEVRAGLLWDTVARGRAKAKGVGIVDYSIRDDEQSIIIDEDGTARLNTKVLRRVHPGISTLTTLAVMQQRFESMPLAQFEREYMCRFPFDSSVGAISAAAWAKDSAGPDLPERPERLALAFDVAPDSSSAALLAAWRDPEGIGHLEVLAYRPRTEWLPQVAAKAARKYRAPVAYDVIGANQDVADRLHRMRVRTAPLSLKHMMGAAGRIASEIEAGHVRHYEQADLTRAVEGSAWRNVGDGGRLFARKQSTTDVSPLVAASEALWQADQITRATGAAGIVVAGGRS